VNLSRPSSRWSLRILATCLVWLAAVIAAQGQTLSPEMRQLFDDLIEHLDGSVKTKLEAALRDDKDYIELTVDEYNVLRNHPSNPFEGWDDIDPETTSGTIRLQFETQPVRSRNPGYLERQYSSVLDRLAPATLDAARSTVRVSNGSAAVALGVIVSPEGHIITKASEVAEHKQLQCRLCDGRVLSAAKVAEDAANDVALLKIDATGLVPVRWSTDPVAPGSFLVTAGIDGRPLAMGVCSHTPRPIMLKNQAYLGVTPEQVAGGLAVRNVTRGGAAAAVGIQVGDIITRLDGQAMTSVEELVNTIRQREPGDPVAVEFLRGSTKREVVATLGGRDVSGKVAKSLKAMNSFGAIPSRRRDEFPQVLQHDTPLCPEQCGGPLVNLNGEIVGINIARAGRTASYAIPAAHMQSLVRELMRPTVAAHDDPAENK